VVQFCMKNDHRRSHEKQQYGYLGIL